MISNFKQNAKLRRMLLVQALASLSVGLVGYRYLKTMAGPDEERPLSPFEFVPLKLTSVTRLTADTSLFTLDVAKPRVKGPNQVVSPDTISSLYVMQPDLQIQRPYTPLSSSYLEDDGPESVQFLVKRYSDGEMSRWLHRLQPNDTIRVKGPVPTWTPPTRTDSDVSEIVFVAGGTGITPAYQYLDRLARRGPEERQASPPVRIVYASQAPSHILLRDELDQLTTRLADVAQVRYVVDRTDGQALRASDNIEVGLMDAKKMASWIGDYDPQRLVVVCGPDGMINYVAGPRLAPNRPKPAPGQRAGGILGQLGYEEKQVVRL